MGLVLVTGASGFIGPRLCQRLREDGSEIRAVMRRPTQGPWDESIQLELGTEPVPPGLLHGVDAVFHLAGRAHALGDGPQAEAAYRRANLQSTLDLLAAARAQGTRAFVLFSSVKALREGWDESNRTVPPDPARLTPYGRSKWLAEQAVLGEGTVPHPVVLRPALVYGPSSKGCLWLMIRAVRGGWFPPLPEVGNARSMVHRVDLVEAALLAATHPAAKHRIYVVTDGHPYRTREIYETILSALGRRAPSWNFPLAPIRLAARAGDLAERLTGRRMPLDSELLDRVLGSALYDGRAIENELGFRARLRLADAIGEMVSTTDRRRRRWRGA